MRTIALAPWFLAFFFGSVAEAKHAKATSYNEFLNNGSVTSFRWSGDLPCDDCTAGTISIGDVDGSGIYDGGSEGAADAGAACAGCMAGISGSIILGGSAGASGGGTANTITIGDAEADRDDSSVQVYYKKLSPTKKEFDIAIIDALDVLSRAVDRLLISDLNRRTTEVLDQASAFASSSSTYGNAGADVTISSGVGGVVNGKLGQNVGALHLQAGGVERVSITRDGTLLYRQAEVVTRDDLQDAYWICIALAFAGAFGGCCLAFMIRANNQRMNFDLWMKEQDVEALRPRKNGPKTAPTRESPPVEDRSHFEHC